MEWKISRAGAFHSFLPRPHFRPLFAQRQVSNLKCASISNQQVDSNNVSHAGVSFRDLMTESSFRMLVLRCTFSTDFRAAKRGSTYVREREAFFAEQQTKKNAGAKRNSGALYLERSLYAAFSAHGSMTIFVTLSFLSRQTLYISGAWSSVMRCEMM
jgi:hypothetical protein